MEKLHVCQPIENSYGICSDFWRTVKLNNQLLLVKPEVCIERARIVTESYKKSEGEPTEIRRAKAIADVLKNMTIFIQKDQLIVGNQASKLRSSPLFPETEALYLEKEIDLFEKREQDRLIVPPEVRKELLEEIVPYWKGKTIQEIALKSFPQKTRDLANLENQIFSVGIHLTGSIGHIIADYEKVLKKGFKGLKQDVIEKLESLDITEPNYGDKYAFYKAELILCNAMVEWAHRYAKEAKRLSQEETDPEWKKELEIISEICEKVPENPATNFREAVQSFWFAHLVLYIEQNGLAVSVGRFDQYMCPFYKNSINKEEITKNKAQELLECLWIKFTEVMRAYDYEGAKYYAGFSISENMVLGGVDSEGNDVTNELSYMCLKAEADTKLSQPNLSVRIHENTPEEFFMAAVRVTSTGRSKPQFFNDRIAIPMLVSLGVPVEEARNYSISGCVEAVPPHCNGMTNAAMNNIAKALELALNNGVCRLTGKQIGPKTGDPRKFTSIEDVLKAFKEQVSAYVKEMISALNIIEKTHAKYQPLPYFSLMMDDCVEKGLDITAGGARYNFTGPQAVGLGNVANSVAAIKKLVFEDKKITMESLINCLDNNFEGQEYIRQMLINKAPKWGNDEDYVDNLGKEVAKIYCDEVSKYKNTRGGVYRPGIYSVSANVPLGLHVAALPDGRKSQQPLADGIAPQHGTDVKGPTAVTRSAAKLDHLKIHNGTILNQKFTPKLMETESGKIALKNLIKSYFDMDGWHIQFNVVDAQTLRNAQKDPEKYKGIIVRVAGYSAFFVELDKAVQDDIINRAEYASF
ncbi:formate C-acetyltransferase [Clostridium algifaecis]|uniref:Formate C-acetyltransferase n=1 Tax=Clostridium algifaecis TaxID=1472040 RepID=A0ABS4KX28_9CLOT|nr:glycyl radical protein [Clostridium algifaecis]MBP2033966.1 formate C-acetyltransferase [Clostridium algifaecis]